MKLRLKTKDENGNPIGAQHFSFIGTFEPGETKDVTDEQAEELLRSPFIEAAGSMQAVEKNSSKNSKVVRGVEP